MTKERVKIKQKININNQPNKKVETEFIERVVESPAKVLDETIEISKTVEN